jgi:hypothetical protein
MRSDYLTRWDGQLTGGLARLARGGAVFTSAWQDQAVTKTAPGHAEMLSGRFPRSTGIFTDGGSVADSGAPLVAGIGPTASPARFRGTTLFDWMHTADAASRAISISRKDDAAILMLGKAKQSVFWFSRDGLFTTSRYYGSSLPSWVTAFNKREIAQSYAGKVWPLFLPEHSYKEPDDVVYENLGNNTTFPHKFPDDPDNAAQIFLAYPAMDSLTAQFALEAVRATNLGAGAPTDLLAVSFSTTDAVGHAFGPDSREIHDQVLRLDRYLGQFLDSLYKLRDSTRVTIVLTSDHGIQSYPELRADREHKPAVRVDIDPALVAVMRALRDAHVDPFDIDFEDGVAAVPRAAIRRRGMNPDSVADVLADLFRRTPGVARVDKVSALARTDTTKDFVARRWIHAIPPDMPADLVVTIDEHAYYAFVRNAYHGTPYDDDAHVPLIFYGAGVVPGTHSNRALVADIAPTLASLIGVTPSERIDGHILPQALRANP